MRKLKNINKHLEYVANDTLQTFSLIVETAKKNLTELCLHGLLQMKLMIGFSKRF